MNLTSLEKIFENSQETLNQFLITQLPINIFLVNKEGYICWANKNLLNFVNTQTIEAVRGTHIRIWDKCRWDAIQEVLKTKQETVEEEFYNGTYFSCIRKPVIQNGEIIGVIGLSIDITEKKQSEVAKQEFLMNIAHDLRTPLVGIIGLANIQAKKQMTQYDQQQYGEWILGASEQLLELLNSAIAIKSIEHKKDSIKQEKVNLIFLAYELQTLIIPSLESKELNFKLQLDPKLSEIITDRIKLKRLLLNLLSNAVKFTKKGTISLEINLLSIKDKQAQISMRVSDTGIGISKDKLEKIFDRFYRVHSSYLAEYSGYGLGLYLVKKSTEALGGTINVSSVEGEGSCFSLEFNFALAEPANSLSANDLEPSFDEDLQSLATTIKLKGSVLVAEDNILIAYVVKKLLTGFGYQVEIASTGEAALQILQTQTFDCGLLDIGLPDLDGIEVTRRYRKWELLNNKPYLPIFALTAHAQEKVKQECQAAGCDQVLLKPFTKKDIKIIEKFLQ